MRPLIARPVEALSGSAAVPGDKSISHRALMLAALAVGESRISGLLQGDDVLRTAAAMRLLGAEISREDDDDADWHVWGRGLGGLVEPAQVIDMGNAGTGARLLLGILASHPISAVLTGDASLRRRPMARVAAPLERIGATIVARDGCRLPLTITGTGEPLPIRYLLPVASAQVKSAVLLAGLNAPGRTTVVEPEATRDHTERLLRHFGVEVKTEEEDEGTAITVSGQPEMSGRPITVPRDPSSAAFPVVAAAILPGSEVRLGGIGMNPRRTGLLETLGEMGASLEFENRRIEAGEEIADLVVRGGPLAGVDVPAERAPSMIDEYPILAVAAALAEGRTVMRGLAELRVKESDRLAVMARGLAACGIEVEEGEDALVVHGGAGRRPKGGAAIETELDHRIAMSFLVLGLASEKGVTIDDAGPIDTSFPGFPALMASLGADFEEGA